MKTALVCVVTGAIYEKFAEALFASAEQFFRPTKEVELLMFEGRPGWPEATMYRHHTLRDHFPDADLVFLSDADMLFVSDVGVGVLGGSGVTATLHPGFVHSKSKPFERNPRSATYLPPHYEGPYYCGGFVGGAHNAMLDLSTQIAAIIDADRSIGLTPVWHDESALNRTLAFSQPEVVLSPAYCYPADDSWYRTVWPEQYEAKLIALDKTEEQRAGRD